MGNGVTGNKIFFVKVRDNYEKDREDYFPYISRPYLAIAKNFQKGKKYPVLAVVHTTMFAEDDKNMETSQFLIPTENGNFIWVQSEIFVFAGLTEE